MRIILLRGLARESAHWFDFPKQLEKALGESAKVELIDFPGCGKYYQQEALVSVEAMTDHARKESNVMASTKPTYVVGISMGGMIALDWAQRFPTELRGIVLINSSTGGQPFWWRLRPRAWLPILVAIALPCELRERLVLNNVSNNTHQYPAHLKQWLAIQQQHPVTRRTIFSMLRAAARFRPQQHCSISGMVLASPKDRFVSVYASNALAAQFNFTLYYHPQAGHDLPMDDPDWVCEKIAHYVRGEHISDKPIVDKPHLNE
jgi:pimeloyl-[acyl-carrier protein] methyl ester esterase